MRKKFMENYFKNLEIILFKKNIQFLIIYKINKKKKCV